MGLRMRKWLNRIGVVPGVLVVVLAAGAVWQRDQITRLLAVNSRFDADRIGANFSHMDQLSFHQTVPRGDGPVSRLPTGPVWVPLLDVQARIADRSVTAMVILKDGQIEPDGYYLGTGADDRRISGSVAKSILPALTGILLAEGTLPSLVIPVLETW